MKKNRIDSFTCFVGFLLILALFFSIKLFSGIQDGKKQYSALVSLGVLTYDDLGNTPVLLLGSKSLQNMKDSNNHSISKKQQEKFLQMGENLTISYALAGNTKELSGAADHLVSLTGHEENEQQTVYLPCKVTAVTENEDIYIPLSQAQELCSEMGEPLKITKIYLKVNGKMNLEKAKKLFE